MQNVTGITLSQSGSPLMVPNELQDAASLSVTYTVNGSPMALTVTCIGVKRAAGEIAVLDSFVGTASTTRTISLSDSFDFFRFVATFSGGQNVSVGVTVTSTGAGAAFTSTVLPAMQTYST